MDPVVILKNATISHNGIKTLSNINLEVKKGEFIYFIGKTGVGKSSLLKVLYGEIPISNGEAKILDVNLLKIKEKKIPFLRRKLGIVFQDFKLLPNITIKENLEFVLKATEWKDKKLIEARISEVLNKVKLENTTEKYPNELSGGEQQRVAIARALLNNPEIILADEPTGSLDMHTAKEVFKLLYNQKKTDRLIIFATHNRFFANKADCLLEMRDGVIKSSNV